MKVLFIVFMISAPIISVSYLATNDAGVKKGIACVVYDGACKK